MTNLRYGSVLSDDALYGRETPLGLEIAKQSPG
jgi:hypothetical protein